MRPVRLVIGDKLLAELVGIAVEARPEEACGILVGRLEDGVARVDETPRSANRAADPRVAFELDPGAWVAAEDAVRGRGLTVLGFWHTHPRGSAEPSDMDLAHALPGMWNLVVDARGGHHAWLQPH
ncbi:MAG: M67 family metallopeptidase [Planctomycetota bacterium]|nr:M67 family metallopeptidase [Planctomycetota bacterium]